METVKLDSIKTNCNYLRLDTNVDKLKKSIQTVGLINPLTINNDDELIAGGRRYTALKELEVEDVQVIRVEKSEKEQELISIDENLVRKDLTNLELEKSLSRGRFLYEDLHPQALKLEEEDLTIPSHNEIRNDMPDENRSFIDITAEKTGLSKKVIKSAIDREEKSSPSVKILRSAGELNASQTNELIKLDENQQESIAELVKGKSAKEIKDIVKKVQQSGIDNTVQEVATAPQLPKEYQSLKTLLKRTNKVLNKIILEEMNSEHDDVSVILDSISTMRVGMDQFMMLCAGGNSSNSDSKIDEEDYKDAVDNAMTGIRTSQEQQDATLPNEF